MKFFIPLLLSLISVKACLELKFYGDIHDSYSALYAIDNGYALLDNDKGSFPIDNGWYKSNDHSAYNPQAGSNYIINVECEGVRVDNCHWSLSKPQLGFNSGWYDFNGGCFASGNTVRCNTRTWC